MNKYYNRPLTRGSLIFADTTVKYRNHGLNRGGVGHNP